MLGTHWVVYIDSLHGVVVFFVVLLLHLYTSSSTSSFSIWSVH
jgi:hypothetical protein